MMVRSYPFVLALITACANDRDTVDRTDGSELDAETFDARTNTPDATVPPPDARPSTVVEVICADAAITVDVTAPGFQFLFSPDDGAPASQYTIGLNQDVRFTMPGGHSAVSGMPNQPDGQFKTDFGEVRCFRFTAAGSFPFHCIPHQFSATLIVQ